MIMEFGTRGIAKIIESADLDFVVYDMEHSGFEVERLCRPDRVVESVLLRAIRARPARPVSFSRPNHGRGSTGCDDWQR